MVCKSLTCSLPFFEKQTIPSIKRRTCSSLLYTRSMIDWNYPGLDARPIGMTVHPQYPDCVHTAVRGMESSCILH